MMSRVTISAERYGKLKRVYEIVDNHICHDKTPDQCDMVAWCDPFRRSLCEATHKGEKKQ